MRLFKDRLPWLAALGCVGFLFVGTAPANDFNTNCTDGSAPACDDTTTSLGTYQIGVIPKFWPLLAGHPGFAGGVLSSPTMFDPNTIIGRSAEHTDGSAVDIGGTAVGSNGTMISDATCPLRPAPCFVDGPVGMWEVHTEIVSLQLTEPGGSEVRAGAPMFGLPVSPGEVESLTNPASGNDFPAESYFCIFAEADIPPGGLFPFTTVYNHQVTPLLICNPNLNNFPPRVVYIHGGSLAAPVLFRNGNPPLWVANEVFGFIVLAGHGIAPRNNPLSESEYAWMLEDLAAQFPPPPIPPTVACDGAESGGTGATSCPAGDPRDYAYPVTDPNGALTDLYIGTDDPAVLNYTNICMPTGWTFAIEADPFPIDHDPEKTAHGAISANPMQNEPYVIHFSGPPPLPGNMFTFGFDHPSASHDVGWRAVEGVGPTTSENWGLHVGLGLGPVHAPLAAAPIPALSEWGLIVMALLVVLAGATIIWRRRALAA